MTSLHRDFSDQSPNIACCSCRGRRNGGAMRRWVAKRLSGWTDLSESCHDHTYTQIKRWGSATAIVLDQAMLQNAWRYSHSGMSRSGQGYMYGFNNDCHHCVIVCDSCMRDTGSGLDRKHGRLLRRASRFLRRGRDRFCRCSMQL